MSCKKKSKTDLFQILKNVVYRWQTLVLISSQKITETKVLVRIMR